MIELCTEYASAITRQMPSLAACSSIGTVVGSRQPLLAVDSKLNGIHQISQVITSAFVPSMELIIEQMFVKQSDDVNCLVPCLPKLWPVNRTCRLAAWPHNGLQLITSPHVRLTSTSHTTRSSSNISSLLLLSCNPDQQRCLLIHNPISNSASPP